MSVWKSTLMLPTLFLSSLRSRPAAADGSATAPGGRSRMAPTGPEILGHWFLDRRYGADLHVAVETFFAADGTFETRTYLNDRGDIERLHAFGTWTVKGGIVVTMPSPTDCRSLGNVTEGCGECGSETLTLEIRNGVKTLLLDLGEVVGGFIGAGRFFTLPDLFAGNSCNRPVTPDPRPHPAFHPVFAIPCNLAA